MNFTCAVLIILHARAQARTHKHTDRHRLAVAYLISCCFTKEFENMHMAFIVKIASAVQQVLHESQLAGKVKVEFTLSA